MPTGRQPTAEISVTTSSRIRVSKEIADAVGAVLREDPIEFMGFFRRPGELICAPAHAKVGGVHPLSPILDHLPEEADELPLSAQDLPQTHMLVLPDRVVDFKAQWTKPQNQLDLQLGAVVIRQLGYNAKADQNRVFVRVRGGLLILMSQAVYSDAVSVPL